ncbi:putative chromatin-remodeling complex ATPase chain Iswi [Monocercomonoides exilis]|uniref:putative chromatin-remodeling complex ATPase chain Iswi n=1 Tax=Monocercomonoides exilis TaxID=2049356 RepID=UPI003559D8EC|nr:putative chromatin-remodeling complex ATPase chain Iswi [Monocercomonoides exilis]|eukprot:MONOS_6976.1-p1 / transcript=MONOS_6976.1 / gene=MONOS_6976 / organism=Monocercomonoides_exilis_PA203 / gene_product=SWI / transcript_product=SWI / location=Mono_scaffold00229:67154-72609(-) / protein_length=1636 / sequence_SO=supercontig / SO=protein_coding / is_pseudo=false
MAEEGDDLEELEGIELDDDDMKIASSLQQEAESNDVLKALQMHFSHISEKAIEHDHSVTPFPEQKMQSLDRSTLSRRESLSMEDDDEEEVISEALGKNTHSSGIHPTSSLSQKSSDQEKNEEEETGKMEEDIQDSESSSTAAKKNKAKSTKTEMEPLPLESVLEKVQLKQISKLTTQPAGIKGEMRSYQLEGLNWLIWLYENGIHGILADEMGLGKTLQTLSLFVYLKVHLGVPGPHLVIGPKSTMGNWMNEVKKFCPCIKAVRLHGDKDQRKEIMATKMKPNSFDLCVTTYEMILIEKAFLRKFKWNYIVVDEAHRIKNDKSKLSTILRTYSSKHRLLLTGTPLQNNLHELWALLNFLLPTIFYDSSKFDDAFKNDQEGANVFVQQLHKMLRPFLLRRLKSDVETLPPKNEIIVFVQMTPMQKQWYRSLYFKDIDAINGLSADRLRLLNIAMQMRKCCNHPYLFPGAEPEPFVDGEHLFTNSGKMVVVDKLVQKVAKERGKVVIFCQMTRMMDILQAALAYRGYRCFRLDGGTPLDVREYQIEEFSKPLPPADKDSGNSIPSVPFIFLISTRAGGLGITLVAANTVILYDSDWNPQADLQAIDRCHRIGQKKPVTIYRLICEHSIEEKVVERARIKLHLDHIVIQQGRLVEQKKALAKEDLLTMIRHGAVEIMSSAEEEKRKEKEKKAAAAAAAGEEGKMDVIDLEDEAAMSSSSSSSEYEFDLDSLLKASTAKTEEWNKKMEKKGEDFKLVFDAKSSSADTSMFWKDANEDAVGDGNDDSVKIIPPPLIFEMPKRERNRMNYSEDAYYRAVFEKMKEKPSSSSSSQTSSRERQAQRIRRLCARIHRPPPRLPFQFFSKRYEELCKEMEDLQIAFIGKVDPDYLAEWNRRQTRKMPAMTSAAAIASSAARVSTPTQDVKQEPQAQMASGAMEKEESNVVVTDETTANATNAQSSSAPHQNTSNSTEIKIISPFSAMAPPQQSVKTMDIFPSVTSLMTSLPSLPSNSLASKTFLPLPQSSSSSSSSSQSSTDQTTHPSPSLSLSPSATTSSSSTSSSHSTSQSKPPEKRLSLKISMSRPRPTFGEQPDNEPFIKKQEESLSVIHSPSQQSDDSNINSSASEASAGSNSSIDSVSSSNTEIGTEITQPSASASSSSSPSSSSQTSEANSISSSEETSAPPAMSTSPILLSPSVTPSVTPQPTPDSKAGGADEPVCIATLEDVENVTFEGWPRMGNGDYMEPLFLSDAKREEMNREYHSGFGDWSKRHFSAFVRGCTRFGRNDIRSIYEEEFLPLYRSKVGAGKDDDDEEKITFAEIVHYSKVFWKRYRELADGEKIVKGIEKGEARAQRLCDEKNAIVATVKSAVAQMRSDTRGCGLFEGFRDEEIVNFLDILIPRFHPSVANISFASQASANLSSFAPFAQKSLFPQSTSSSSFPLARFFAPNSSTASASSSLQSTSQFATTPVPLVNPFATQTSALLGNSGWQASDETSLLIIISRQPQLYGKWKELHEAVVSSPLFRFRYFIRSRTAEEIRKRAESLAHSLMKRGKDANLMDVELEAAEQTLKKSSAAKRKNAKPASKTKEADVVEVKEKPVKRKRGKDEPIEDLTKGKREGNDSNSKAANKHVVNDLHLTNVG